MDSKWIFLPLLLFFCLFVILNHDNGSVNSDESNVQMADTASQNIINYEIVEKWDIADVKDGGMLIVIRPENSNLDDLQLLGKQLNAKYESGDRVAISIFTDTEAAKLRNKSAASGSSTREEIEFYEKHYVGNYSKNRSSGYNQLNAWPEGASGDVSEEYTY